MTQDQALKIALEALETALDFDIDAEDGYYLQAITAIKEALAQEQEPLALPLVQFEKVAEGIEVGYDVFGGVDIRLGGEFVYVHINYDYRYTHNAERKALAKQIVGLLTTPPQRKPLTDEQIDEEFKLYASQFDTSSDKWLDMSADDYFKAGFKAAHGIKEKNT